MSFLRNECGAALVEYAVGLIIVTIIGGAGVLSLGSDTRVITENASATIADAVESSTDG